MLPPPPRPTLFPYTTLFRSDGGGAHRQHVDVAAQRLDVLLVLDAEALLLVDDDQPEVLPAHPGLQQDRKSTRLNSSHVAISYAVFCLKKKKLRIVARMHGRD